MIAGKLFDSILRDKGRVVVLHNCDFGDLAVCYCHFNDQLPPNPSALPRWVPSPTLISYVGLAAGSSTAPDTACSTAANTALLVAVAPLTVSTGPWPPQWPGAVSRWQDLQ